MSIAALAQALENALEMLRSLEEDFAPRGSDIRWEIVRARMQSPLTLTFLPSVKGKPARGIGNRIAKACVRGIEEMEKEPTLPKHFKEETLDAVQKLIKTVNDDGGKVTFSSNGKKVSPGVEAVKNIHAVIETARRYIDYGTIEGQLQTVSVRGTQHFFTYETFTDNKVMCSVTPEQFQQWMSLLGKRVAVTGRIRYRNHQPQGINVENIRVLRDSSELPQLAEIPPIDITSGLPAEEYVRRMRDAQ
ncbi:MAG TPA: OB-fold nucleic acid binding domain-containing protein [Gemmataceae bacterium]|nr:OB-fold nucleic acid binding domain-containing protein [Gemmataceae bacterium]